MVEKIHMFKEGKGKIFLLYNYKKKLFNSK